MSEDGVTRRSVMATAAIGAVAAGNQAAAAQSSGPQAGLTFATNGPICTITLNRTQDDNRLDRQVLRELPQAWEAFRGDDSLKVAIFTGAGTEAFCGGVDSSTFRRAPSTYLRRDEGTRSYTSKQNKVWKPVIAAINGFVAGPGLHFMLDADICLSVPDATFFDMHMHHTGSVPIIEPVEMARKIPAEAVSRMFLLGPHDPISAERALQLGLISEIVPRQRLLARARELAEQIAQADMHLTTAFIEAFYKSRELGVTEAVNRGLIIRQLVGYHDAPLNHLSLKDLARPGSKL